MTWSPADELTRALAAFCSKVTDPGSGVPSVEKDALCIGAMNVLPFTRRPRCTPAVIHLIRMPTPPAKSVELVPTVVDPPASVHTPNKSPVASSIVSPLLGTVTVTEEGSAALIA